MVYTTNSEKETFELGIKIGNCMKKGDVISLNGDLGAGKTHLVKGIAKAFGIDECITSPTFTIVNEYKDGRLPLYHFDVYRINDIDEMYEIGFDEYLYGDGVCVIEWGNIVDELLPENTIRIDIKVLEGENRRQITITGDK